MKKQLCRATIPLLVTPWDEAIACGGGAYFGIVARLVEAAVGM